MSKTIILDSAPSVPMRISSSAQALHVGPRQKRRGPPLLGMQRSDYTHFVPLGEGSKHIKKLLELPESDTSPPKLIEGYTESSKPPSNQEPIQVDSAFKEAAQQYLEAPKSGKEDSFFSKEEDPSPLIGKNSADLANEVAAVAPKPKKKKPLAVGMKQLTVPQPQKKKVAAPKKLTSFRVVSRKKKNK